MRSVVLGPALCRRGSVVDGHIGAGCEWFLGCAGVIGPWVINSHKATADFHGVSLVRNRLPLVVVEDGTTVVVRCCRPAIRPDNRLDFASGLPLDRQTLLISENQRSRESCIHPLIGRGVPRHEHTA